MSRHSIQRGCRHECKYKLNDCLHGFFDIVLKFLYTIQMRKILITTLLFYTTCLFAQTTRHLSIELLGTQNTVGINYDSRFRGIDGLGYRVGIGYCYSKNSGWFDERIKGIGMPLELNYLLGKKSSKLELGFGASLGGYHVKEKTVYYTDAEWYSDQYNSYEKVTKSYQYTSSGYQFGYFLFGNIGYRYQRSNGLMFRIGMSPSFNFGDKYGIEKSAFYPYLGFGWSF